MNFHNYQELASGYALKHIKYNISYMALGLSGESGEVAEKVKKVLRDDMGVIQTTKKEEEIALELGDVLWYVSQMARLVGYDLEDIAALNLEKLKNRKENGKLSGSGDNR